MFCHVGMREIIFPKNRKKGFLFTFLVINIVYVWQNWRFFDQIWAWQHEVFHKNWKNMTFKHIVFERMDVIFDKIWAWESLFFREWTFFSQNMGMSARIFSWKSERKAILLTFMAQNIVLTDLTFFDQISALQQRVFHEKF